jgi:hypothetical protein
MVSIELYTSILEPLTGRQVWDEVAKIQSKPPSLLLHSTQSFMHSHIQHTSLVNSHPLFPIIFVRSCTVFVKPLSHEAGFAPLFCLALSMRVNIHLYSL